VVHIANGLDFPLKKEQGITKKGKTVVEDLGQRATPATQKKKGVVNTELKEENKRKDKFTSQKKRLGVVQKDQAVKGTCRSLETTNAKQTVCGQKYKTPETDGQGWFGEN